MAATPDSHINWQLEDITYDLDDDPDQINGDEAE